MKILGLSRRSANHKKIATMSNALGKRAGKAAQQVADTFEKESRLVSLSENIETVKDEDMQLGEILGQGGFNIAREVTLKGKPKIYALKHLKPDIMSKQKEFIRGATDLVEEACLLKSLNHPNVITLHALTERPIQDAYQEGSHHYFLVLDRLECTVWDKLDQWRRERSSQEENINFHSNEYQMQVEQRIQSIALPVARALEYLHSKQIVFRDLKPANVGFDYYDGTVKLFDFGLARELPKGGQMKGSSGSRRYMAPEVVLFQFYGVKADVFSFGVFLWEIASLGLPFGNLVANRSHYVNKVAFDNYRPELGPQCGSEERQRLIHNCWRPHAGSRPRMSQVVAKLSGQQETPQEIPIKPAAVTPPVEQSKEVAVAEMKKAPSNNQTTKKTPTNNRIRFWKPKVLRDSNARAA